MDGTRARTPGDLVVIAVFLALLIVPGDLALSGHTRADTAFLEHMEGRRAFVAPPVSSGALATAGYERDLERQIADAFPLRTQLVTAYAYVKFAWLGDSTTTHTVRGRDGWIFYANEESSYATGAWRPSDAELSHIARVYGDRARWCKQRGIRYVFAIAPNKSTIYADEAPIWYRPVSPTPLDRLLPLLAAQGVTTIDVRAQLIDAARHSEVYSRGDSHWNGAGAYIAYRAIVGALRSAGVRDAIQLTGSHVALARGDLLSINGVGDLIPDRVVTLDYPIRTVAARAPEYEPEAAAAQFSMDVRTIPDPNLPKLMLVGDSFSNALAPLLAEDSRRSVHLQQGPIDRTPQFDRAIIEAERPAAVVQELVERNLYFGARFQP